MKLKKLHSLNLNHNIIKELPTKMNEMHCLVNLHLSFNNITCISHQLFSGRLSHTLQMLDLSNNKIMSHCCRHPSNFSRISSSLAEMSLWENMLRISHFSLHNS
ncbi:hypothetical protein OTU49_016377 [Cherax quadricarinatus]|uniref:Uncharacterized protein n=1 Tax=Cherax quadricarinatus TaxID=27406 RepID=A0AAW0YSK6_CHEQU